MASAEMVLVLDGYPNQTITGGGSGDVVVSAKLQKKVVARIATPVPLTREEREKERDTAAPIPVPASPSPSPVAAAAAPAKPPAAVATTAAPSPAAVPLAPNGDVVPFGEGMTRPRLVTPGKPVSYSREALEARVEGTMIVKCTITVEGQVERCTVLKTLPFLEEAVLQSLYSSRYSPVTFQGKPVAVGYTFNVRLVPPS
jgi:serine/threonine-protein kinase